MDGKIGIKLSNLEKSVVFAQSTSANGKLISQTRFLCEVPWLDDGQSRLSKQSLPKLARSSLNCIR